MSDLAATNCNTGCGCNSDNGCSWIIWILILLSCCGNNNCFGGGCGCNGGDFNCIFLILIILCCCGNGNSIF